MLIALQFDITARDVCRGGTERVSSLVFVFVASQICGVVMSRGYYDNNPLLGFGCCELLGNIVFVSCRFVVRIAGVMCVSVVDTVHTGNC